MTLQQDTLVVLTQSTEATRDLLPLWTGLLGGVLGIAATLISAHYASRASREQIEAQRALASKDLEERAAAQRLELMATFVSASRTRWIETLRTEVAGYCSAVVAAITDASAKVPAADIFLKIDKANHHAAMIDLLLNHDEADSLELIQAIAAMSKWIDDGTALDPDKVDHVRGDRMLKDIYDCTRRITKSEWVRVKTFS